MNSRTYGILRCARSFASRVAEDEGFEPSRLSSTRVRDARTRPLCESSGRRILRLLRMGAVNIFRSGWLSGMNSRTYGILRRRKCCAFPRAEDEGFEPSKGCPLHAFQACALGRYANPPARLFSLECLTCLSGPRVSEERSRIYPDPPCGITALNSPRAGMQQG